MPIGVLLVNGAQVRNVFWYVPAGAVIGTGSTMTGTLLADAYITLSATGGSPPTAPVTTLNGRAIALTAAGTMTNKVINVPGPRVCGHRCDTTYRSSMAMRRGATPPMGYGLLLQVSFEQFHPLRITPGAKRLSGRTLRAWVPRAFRAEMAGPRYRRNHEDLLA